MEITFSDFEGLKRKFCSEYGLHFILVLSW